MTSTPLNAGHPGACLYEAVVAKDYDILLKLYAVNARNSVASYLTMKSRLAQQQETYAKSGTDLIDAVLEGFRVDCNAIKALRDYHLRFLCVSF